MIRSLNDDATKERIHCPGSLAAVVEFAAFDDVPAEQPEANEVIVEVASAWVILSGLLRCGACGGWMALVGPDRSNPDPVQHISRIAKLQKSTPILHRAD